MKRNDCEKVIVRILDAILGYTVPSMIVKVIVGMCGDKPFTIQQSKQMTLHDYADIGVRKNEEEKYEHLDIILNKTVIADPDIGGIICTLLDAVESKTEQFRLMR